MSQTEYAVQVASSAEVSLIDCDVHNYPNSIDDLMPYLSARWQAYVRQSGFKRSTRANLSQRVCPSCAARCLAAFGLKAGRRSRILRALSCSTLGTLT